MQKHGEDTLYDYTQDFLDINKAPALDARKRELILVVEDLLSDRLGEGVAQNVSKQLNDFPLVSTADHHSPIQHPFWVNANIISAIPLFSRRSTNKNFLVVLSFSSVSMNNASGYPCGIQFHSGQNESEKLIKLSIFPDKVKMSTVYGMRPFSSTDISKVIATIDQQSKINEINSEKAEKIKDILKKYYLSEDVLSSLDYATQITKINYNLWPNFFRRKEKDFDDCPVNQLCNLTVPSLVYLEIETIVKEILLKYHLNNQDSLIYRFLFDTTWRDLVLSLFNNVIGAFNADKRWGTCYFWLLNDKGRRVNLFYKDGYLVPSDGSESLELKPREIGRLLTQKKIFPSMLLCYLIVSLYYGFKCLGGFCQVNDLTVIKDLWQKFLESVGEKDESLSVVPVQTKELGGDGMVLAYIKNASGDLIPATGLDMICKKGDTCFEKYFEFSKTLTLSEIMNPMLPEMYVVVSKAEERDPELVNISPEQITSFTGLNKKITKITL